MPVLIDLEEEKEAEYKAPDTYTGQTRGYLEYKFDIDMQIYVKYFKNTCTLLRHTKPIFEILQTSQHLSAEAKGNIVSEALFGLTANDSISKYTSRLKTLLHITGEIGDTKKILYKQYHESNSGETFSIYVFLYIRNNQAKKNPVIIYLTDKKLTAEDRLIQFHDSFSHAVNSICHQKGLKYASHIYIEIFSDDCDLKWMDTVRVNYLSRHLLYSSGFKHKREILVYEKTRYLKRQIQKLSPLKGVYRILDERSFEMFENVIVSDSRMTQLSKSIDQDNDLIAQNWGSSAKPQILINSVVTNKQKVNNPKEYPFDIDAKRARTWDPMNHNIQSPLSFNDIVADVPWNDVQFPKIPSSKDQSKGKFIEQQVIAKDSVNFVNEVESMPNYVHNIQHSNGYLTSATNQDDETQLEQVNEDENFDKDFMAFCFSLIE